MLRLLAIPLLLTGCNPVMQCDDCLTYDELSKLTQQTHDRFTYRSDMEQYGVKDKWVISKDLKPFYGDCEDFSLAVNYQLKQMGYSSEILLVRDQPKNHVVLLYEGMVIDNKNKWPIPLEEANLDILYRNDI